MHHVITHRCGNNSCCLCHAVPADRPRLMIVGHARHGKDTVAEYLRDKHGFKFASSSMWCAEKIMMPYFNGLYQTVEECYEDRVNHRAEWFNQIVAFNNPDKSSLGREILKDNDIYVGIRDWRELYACRNANLIDFTVWVDATTRGLPLEPTSSMTIEPWMANYILDNNGDRSQLRRNVDQMLENFKRCAS
jgi:hypothetical protein